jgi:phosphoglycolate phosphatase-like HAD superfamily hydrolase
MFDIDGTLFFSSQDLGGKAMIQAMHRTFPHGSGFSRHGVHLGGRVDSAIAQDVAMSGGVARDLFMEHKDQFVCAYAEEMARVLEEGRRHGIVRPCLNVIELLNRLNCEEDVVLGIVSGNFKEIGPIKLKAVGIDPEMFKVCAYGSDHSSRNELPKIALVIKLFKPYV